MIDFVERFYLFSPDKTNMATMIKAQTAEETAQFGMYGFAQHISPDKTDEENYTFLERHLFHEVITNITVGLADEDYVPPSLQDQKEFFKRPDVRDRIRKILIDFLSQLREDEEWEGGMEYDWIREHIYAPNSLGEIYDRLPKKHRPIHEQNADIAFLSWDEYEPIF